MLRWLFFATLSLVLFLQLRGLDSDLRTSDTPQGIVGYELAWSADRANAMLRVWRNAGTLEAAKVSLGVDFAFLLVYPWLFASSIVLLLRNRSRALLVRSGRVLSRAVLLCIPLDALENLVLWRMIDVGATDGLARVAATAASVKFLLLLCAVLWCIAALMDRVVARPSAAK